MSDPLGPDPLRPGEAAAGAGDTAGPAGPAGEDLARPTAAGSLGNGRRRPVAPVRPRRRRSASARRLPVIAGVAALLAVGGLADRSSGHALPPPASPTQPVPVAAPAIALSSSWFCAGASGAAGSATAGRVVIANAGSAPLTAIVHLLPSSGRGTVRVVGVAAHASATVDESLPAKPLWIGAVVDLDGGAAAVTQVISGPLGVAATPCATAGSASWYFAAGATLVNAADEITLLNPCPTDAVVDMSFSTDQGSEAPADFQGLDVPAGGLLAVDLGSHLRRRQQIATTVRARTGRIVAWSTTVVTPPAAGEALVGAPPDPANPTSADPAAAAPGVVLTLGSSSTGTVWSWPDGLSGNGLDERYAIYNPSPQPATVTLSLVLDQGQAEPFNLTIGPQQVTTVVAGSEARIPPGVGHSATLASTNGVGVVATRILTGVPPASRGTASLPGSRLAAPAWLVPAATEPGTTSDLAVLVPGTDPLDATVYGWRGGREVALAGLSNLTLAPGQRNLIALSIKAPGYTGPVVVRASGPVEVEADLYGSTSGISLSTGVPLS